jgi:sugar lactone lactonase YvrE
MFKFRFRSSAWLASSCGAVLALAVTARAVETQFWQQSEQADFEKGTRKGVALRSDGLLMLGPEVKEVFDAALPYLWSAARDAKGNLYLGGGGSEDGSARIFVVSAEGEGRKLTDLPGIAIPALAVDGGGRLYAATTPSGKVYRVSADGHSEVFFDPHARYIWALTFAKDGALFVATGDPGRVFRVMPDGSSSEFFATDEANVRSLALDGRGDLIAGTAPSGLIVQLKPDTGAGTGRAFVLYEAEKTEITALAVAPNGDIYAAAAGAKAPAHPAAGMVAAPVAPAAAVSAGGQTAPAEAAPAALTHVLTPLAGGTEVIRITADGAPRAVFSDAQATVYAIAFDPQGKALLGSGNKGVIYRVETSWLSTELVDLAPTQVTAFAAGGDGGLYAVTGNIGKVYRIGPETVRSGTFDSSVYDAGTFTHWGAVSLEPKPKGAVEVETRSGNTDRPEQNWSEWQKAPLSGDSGRVASPAARFLQYRLRLSRGASDAEDPRVSMVTVAYLTKNLPPEVQEMEITPPNYKFPPQVLSTAPSANITLPPLGGHRSAAALPRVDIAPAVTMNYEKGYLGVRWTAADPNGDTLGYKVEIRGVNETEWRLLKDKLREKEYSFDSRAFADGDYVIRVTASDEPSNPVGKALSDTLVSDPFTIDNTPPLLARGALVREAGGTMIRCRARDASSILVKAEISLDGGDWQRIEPVSGISDAKEEEYLVPAPEGQHVVALRVTDDYDNQAVMTLTAR